MGERLQAALIRRRTFLLAALPAAAVLLARPRLPLYVMGLALVFAGQALRLWSAGFLAKNERLATTGPYAWVRNPLYLGSLLLTLAWGAMSGRPEVAAGLLAAYFLTHWPTICAEERLLRERFGADYDDYCRRVPRLLPRPRRQPPGAGEFSWQRAWQANRERRGILGVVLLAAAYGSRFWW